MRNQQASLIGPATAFFPGKKSLPIVSFPTVHEKRAARCAALQRAVLACIEAGHRFSFSLSHHDNTKQGRAAEASLVIFSDPHAPDAWTGGVSVAIDGWAFTSFAKGVFIERRMFGTADEAVAHAVKRVPL